MDENHTNEHINSIKELDDIIENTYESYEEARNQIRQVERRKIHMDERTQRRIECVNHYRAEISEGLAYLKAQKEQKQKR